MKTLKGMQVREFLMALPRRGILADVGCGNGKYFAVRPDLVVLASDRSFGLAAKASALCGPDRGAREPGLGSSVADAGGAGVAPRAPLADVIVADGMCLPYRVSPASCRYCGSVLQCWVWTGCRLWAEQLSRWESREVYAASQARSRFVYAAYRSFSLSRLLS